MDSLRVLNCYSTTKNRSSLEAHFVKEFRFLNHHNRQRTFKVVGFLKPRLNLYGGYHLGFQQQSSPIVCAVSTQTRFVVFHQNFDIWFWWISFVYLLAY